MKQADDQGSTLTSRFNDCKNLGQTSITFSDTALRGQIRRGANKTPEPTVATYTKGGDGVSQATFTKEETCMTQTIFTEGEEETGLLNDLIVGQKRLEKDVSS